MTGEIYVVKMAKVREKLLRRFLSAVNGEGRTVWRSYGETLSQENRDREKELKKRRLMNDGHA